MGASTHENDLRLLVVGLDGSCRSVLEPLLEAGEIPTIERLVESGSSGPLESQIPPWTASAWPSIYTGKNPGKHGVYDFFSFDGYDWDVVNATHVRERPVWELLSEYGLASVVVNVPVTHPPRAFDGALIPGLTAPDEPVCHPEGLLEDVKMACDGYHVYPQGTDAPNESIESYERVIEDRGAAFRYLVRRTQPAFGFLQFQATDTVFHERPGDKEAIEAVYRAVDRQLDETLAETEPENVLLVSDHGMSRVTGAEFRINEFLRERGYLTVESGGGMPDWSTTWEKELLSGDGTGGGSGPSPLERALGLAATAGVTPQRVASVLDRLGLKEAIGKRVPDAAVRAVSQRVDFRESKAYVRSKGELGVRINLEGREPNGRVSEADYEEVRAELIDELSSVRTPDGEPMFEAVEPRESYFEGPYVDEAPDVLTVPAGFDNAIVADVGSDQFGEPTEPWNHERTGIVAAVGSAFDETAALDEATIFDVAPTICALFDVPIDAEMDGTTLPVVDAGEETTYPDYEPDPITATDDAAVEDHLSDLGYL